MDTVFFVRRYNDIDHLVPVISKMAELKHPVSVFSLNPLLDLSDFRLVFLEKEYGIKTRTLISAQAFSPLQKLALKILTNKSIWRVLSPKETAPPKILQWCFENLFGEAACEKFLRKLQPKRLVFDWQEPKRWNTPHLLEAARHLGLETMILPHGAAFEIDPVWNRKSIAQGIKSHEFKGWNCFDRILVQYRLWGSKTIRAGLTPGSVFALGSARFCKEWLTTYQKIIPKADLPKTDRLKVVYMDQAATFRADVKRTVQTFRRLKELGFAEVIVKPSTASQEAYTSMELSKYAKIDTQSHSLELIKWADVVIGTISSILVDALTLEKIFIFPRYMNENTLLWDLYESCWAVNSEKEFLSALRTIEKNRTDKPYSKKNVSRFLTETVYGGDENRDVLLDHVGFILGEDRVLKCPKNVVKSSEELEWLQQKHLDRKASDSNQNKANLDFVFS